MLPTAAIPPWNLALQGLRRMPWILSGILIEEQSLEEFKVFSPLFETDVLDAVQLKSCMEAKKSYGSTAQSSILTMIENGRIFLKTENGRFVKPSATILLSKPDKAFPS